jgi:arylsulfatase A-like enzyme
MKVTLIVADGLQLAALGAYGNDWLPTPNLDRLAAGGVVFDQHFADVPSAGWNRGRHAFPPAELLVNTFDVFDLQVIDLSGLLPPWDPPAEMLAERFEDWDFDDEPQPWPDPPAGWIDPADEVAFARLQRTYAAAVCQFDQELGDRLDGLDENDLLILTATRGQNLGEHGLIGDVRPWLHEELVHLPLIVRLPGKEQAGRRISNLTQTVDLAPTILGALGLARPGDWHGHSLLPMCRGGGPVRSYACMGLQIGDAVEYALQTAAEKVVLPAATPAGDPPRGPMYFVKPDDRWEVNDVRQHHLDRAEALERTLRNYVAASAEPGRFDPPPLPEWDDHATAADFP